MQGRQNEVTGQRGLNSDFARFQVAHLAHHYDVRVLAQERTQRVGKHEPSLGVHLNLGYAV